MSAREQARKGWVMRESPTCPTIPTARKVQAKQRRASAGRPAVPTQAPRGQSAAPSSPGHSAAP
eukprot:15483054-Alexandrium_andersonii.AAC.1